ncbi:MAG: hypothetical protein AB1481_06370, partial [Candidatus Omnitrophota bacterium]
MKIEPKRTYLVIAFILFGLFFSFGLLLFAQETEEKAAAEPEEVTQEQEVEAAPAQEEKALPSTEEPGVEKQTLEVNPEIIGKKMRAYTLSLKELVEEAERKVKTIDKEIEEAELLGRNRLRERDVRKHFAIADLLYSEGRLSEAKSEWEKAVSAAKESEFKSYVYRPKKVSPEVELYVKHLEEGETLKDIEEFEQRRREEFIAKQEEEQAKRKKYLERKEEARKKREEKLRLEAEQKEKALQEAEERRKEELRRKEEERIEKEEQARLERERKEK